MCRIQTAKLEERQKKGDKNHRRSITPVWNTNGDARRTSEKREVRGNNPSRSTTPVWYGHKRRRSTNVRKREKKTIVGVILLSETQTATLDERHKKGDSNKHAERHARKFSLKCYSCLKYKRRRSTNVRKRGDKNHRRSTTPV